jgi:hypothetical protein
MRRGSGRREAEAERSTSRLEQRQAAGSGARLAGAKYRFPAAGAVEYTTASFWTLGRERSGVALG